jgi:hypothetical protein
MREGPADRKVKDISNDNRTVLDERVRVGKVVARFLNSPDWNVIEDIIMAEGRTDELVSSVMSKTMGKEDLEQALTNVVHFGVVTRIINRLHVAVEMGERADEHLRKLDSAEPVTEKKERSQSERRGKGSPR